MIPGASTPEWLTFGASAFAFTGTLVLALFARRSASHAEAAARATQDQTSPLIRLTGGFRSAHELDHGVYLHVQVENAGKGPALKISVAVTHPSIDFKPRTISALGERDNESLDLGTRFYDLGELEPYGGPLWDKFSTEVRYHDARLAHVHTAKYNASPVAEEYGADAYPHVVDFQLDDIDVNRVSA